MLFLVTFVSITMRIFLLLSFLLLAGASGYSQQLHFAYLQTDTHTPFYVSLNKKNYSSTASGYIILPKLLNGDYPVRIGFAKSEEAEQEYVLQVKDNDQGLLIKNFGDKGWGLFDLQTMAVQYAGTAAREKAKLAAVEKEAAEQRRRKADEEMQAAASQRYTDSVKMTAASQRAYTDSLATVAAANRQQTTLDSLAHQQTLALQQHVTDSIARQQTLALQQHVMDSVNTANATVRENKRLEKAADSLAKAQNAVIERQAKKATETAKQANANETATPPAPLPQKQVPVKNNSAPALIQQIFTDTGWHYAYHITNNSLRETVDVFIPSAQPRMPVNTTAITEKETTPVVAVRTDSIRIQNSSMGTDTTTIRTEITTVPVIDKPMIAVKAVTPPLIGTDSIQVAAAKPAMNPNCRGSSR